jgi:hypothetical protein
MGTFDIQTLPLYCTPSVSWRELFSHHIPPSCPHHPSSRASFAPGCSINTSWSLGHNLPSASQCACSDHREPHSKASMTCYHGLYPAAHTQTDASDLSHPSLHLPTWCGFQAPRLNCVPHPAALHALQGTGCTGYLAAAAAAACTGIGHWHWHLHWYFRFPLTHTSHTSHPTSTLLKLRLTTLLHHAIRYIKHPSPSSSARPLPNFNTICLPSTPAAHTPRRCFPEQLPHCVCAIYLNLIQLGGGRLYP